MSKLIGFTQKRIESETCPPGQDRVWLRDSGEAKLYLSVAAGGTKTFYLYSKINGAPAT